jgi:hypothetical protein
MTDQYGQTNINRQRPARFVDQSNFDVVVAATDMVSLGNDATFILLGSSVPIPTPYNVLLPNVQTVDGFFFYFRNSSGATVTVNAQAGQEINGNPTIDILQAEVAIIVSDPINNNTTPPTLPVGWSLIKNGPA